MRLGVFISWSGERSKLLAREVVWWLPRVLSGIRPWMSDKDIPKGQRWSFGESCSPRIRFIGRLWRGFSIAANPFPLTPFQTVRAVFPHTA